MKGEGGDGDNGKSEEEIRGAKERGRLNVT